VVADKVTAVGRDDDVPPGTGRRLEILALVVQVPDQPADSVQAVEVKRRQVMGHRPRHVFQDLPALVV
jgi:hypothetical protein